MTDKPWYDGMNPQELSRTGYVLNETCGHHLAEHATVGALVRIAVALEALADPERREKVAAYRQKKADMAEHMRRWGEARDACADRLKALIPSADNRKGVSYWKLLWAAVERLGVGRDWADSEEAFALVVDEIRNGTFTADDFFRKGSKRHAKVLAGMTPA